jgi:hypothetical protein
MQAKPKINLYNIQVAKNPIHILAPQKSFTNVKIVLFSSLAITTMASIGQAVFAFDSKTSFADSQTQSSSISSSSRLKVSR